jgi:hypothetical protein
MDSITLTQTTTLPLQQFAQAHPRADAAPRTELVIRPVAPFQFEYARVSADTGETLWRWPEPKGQLLDLAV